MALITRKQAAAKVTDALAAEDVSILALARTSTSWIMTERTELTVAIPRDSSGGLPEDTIVKINLENRELSDAQARKCETWSRRESSPSLRALASIVATSSKSPNPQSNPPSRWKGFRSGLDLVRRAANRPLTLVGSIFIVLLLLGVGVWGLRDEVAVFEQSNSNSLEFKLNCSSRTPTNQGTSLPPPLVVSRMKILPTQEIGRKAGRLMSPSRDEFLPTGGGKEEWL
jgi:hypothetical protein